MSVETPMNANTDDLGDDHHQGFTVSKLNGRVYFKASIRLRGQLKIQPLGALYPSESGLIHKRIVKHGRENPVALARFVRVFPFQYRFTSAVPAPSCLSSATNRRPQHATAAIEKRHRSQYLFNSLLKIRYWYRHRHRCKQSPEMSDSDVEVGTGTVEYSLLLATR